MVKVMIMMMTMMMRMLMLIESDGGGDDDVDPHDGYAYCDRGVLFDDDNDNDNSHRLAWLRLHACTMGRTECQW